MTATTSSVRQRRRAAIASWIGTTVEYYDYACYGIAASLVFADLFFPSSDPFVATLLSLSSFAVGYVARPLGALIFGHFGDRVGRRTILIVTLVLMGAATFAIGLLPTHRQVGAAAPTLLVITRVLQGISAGGEYGGAVLMTVEHAGRGRRGFFGSLVNTGTTAGLVLANLVFLPVLGMNEDSMHAWGWRIPFLFSAVLVVIGLVVRLAVEETPEFHEVKRHHEVRRLPVVDLFRACWRTVLLVALGIIGAGTTFTMATVYSLTYGKSGLGLSGNRMLAVLLPATVVVLVTVPLFGRLADRIGVRPVFMGGAVMLVVAPFAWFALLDTRQYGWMLLGFALLFVGYAANYAVVPAYFSGVFPSAVRFSGMSIAFTVGLIVSNAIAPAVSESLLAATGGWTAIAAYMAAASLVTLVAGVFLRAPDAPADERPGEPSPAAHPVPLAQPE
ncbi:MFS transporter [Actinoallomurus sp. CA-142502]|uniref:MFS transporter n=1 Tax=Actinoallomurus sp. CA-142502 TaxID=3239885 RepID=UPI003D943491